MGIKTEQFMNFSFVSCAVNMENTLSIVA